MRLLSSLLALVLVLLASATAHTKDDDDSSLSYQAEIEQWCQGRLGWLTKPDGYLALTGLHWLNEKPQTFKGIGEAHLDGQDVILKLEPGVTLEGKPVSEYRVTPEMPRGTPDFQQGTSHFFVIRHGKKVALRVKDPNSETLKNFAGVERFPVDRKWRIEARYEADKQTIPVLSVVDEMTDEVSPGYAVFEWAGKTHKLRLMGEEADETYFLVFSDATAGKTTYSGCRFLEVEKGEKGALILDFNKSENPPCSMTPYATCPLPPKGNVLPFEIAAGEKTPPGGSH